MIPYPTSSNVGLVNQFVFQSLFKRELTNQRITNQNMSTFAFLIHSTAGSTDHENIVWFSKFYTKCINDIDLKRRKLIQNYVISGVKNDSNQ